MVYRKRKKTLGFTLIEVMISLFLSVMVAFFVYTMMISSYNVFRRISSVSKNANSIRFFISSFERSVAYARYNSQDPSDPLNPVITESEMKFHVYDASRAAMVTERYYFHDGGNFKSNVANSTNMANLGAAIDYYMVNSGKKLGQLKKDIILSDGRIVETVVISNVIRTIYFSYPAVTATDQYRKINFGVVYDDIIDASQNTSTGKIIVTGDTEFNTAGTLQKKLYSFRILNSFRS